MTEIGHNTPQGGVMCFTAGEVCMDLSRWMAEHPVILNEVEVKEATVLIDRAVLCIKDMEDERKAQTRPLREKVQEIDDSYRGPRGLLESVTNELKSRWQTFVNKIETERAMAVEAAREHAERVRESAQEATRDAERAIDNARSGELGIDVGEIVQNANAAIAASERADRKAAILERETKVGFKGIFKRKVLVTRTLEHLEDPYAVLAVTGITPGVAKEIFKAARAYKKIHGNYPPGIRIETERRL